MRSTPRSRSVGSTCTRAERTPRTGTDCALARARATRAAPARASAARLSPRAGGTGIAARAPPSIPPARTPWCSRVRPLLRADEQRGPAHDGERAEPGKPRVEGCRNDPLAGTAGVSRCRHDELRSPDGRKRRLSAAGRAEKARSRWLGGPGLPERAETAAGGGETCREGPLAVTGDRRSSNGRKRWLGAPRRAEEARSRWLGDRVAGARRTGGNGGSVRRYEQRRPARGDRVTGLAERAVTAARCGEKCRRGPLGWPARDDGCGRARRVRRAGARGAPWGRVGAPPGQRVGPRAARRLTASDRTSRRLQNAKRTSDR